MSVTLTDRDSGTLVLTQAGSSAGAVTFAVAGGSLSDSFAAMVRHSGNGVVGKNSRHNIRLERSKINAGGVLKTMSVDITLSVPNDGTFDASAVDNLITAAASYFDSEATTANFTIGVVKA